MNNDSVSLLKECTSGCKMAIASIRQVESMLHNNQLKGLMTDYKHEHEEIENEADKLLSEAGKEDKEPSMVASAFSWLKTEAKMMMDDEQHQVAKLMMDGCSMGIETITTHINQYEEADREATDVANRLVKLEEEMMEDMKKYL